jgi:hypothetical protein
MSLVAAIAAAAAAKGDSRLASRLSVASVASSARQDMRARIVSRRLGPKEMSYEDDRPEVSMLEYMAAVNRA